MTLNCLCFWTKWPVSYGKGSYFHAKKRCVSFQIPYLIDNLALPFFDQILIFYIWSTAHPQNFFFIGKAFSFLFEIHFTKRASTGSILVEKWISHNWQDLTNYSNAFRKRTFFHVRLNFYWMVPVSSQEDDSAECYTVTILLLLLEDIFNVKINC